MSTPTSTAPGPPAQRSGWSPPTRNTATAGTTRRTSRATTGSSPSASELRELLRREHELEPAPATQLAVELDRPAECHRELSRDREAEPCPFPVVRPERTEDALLLLGADPGTRVFDRDVDQSVLRAQP